MNSCVKSETGSRLEVYENHWHKGEQDSSEVNDASAESSMLFLGISELQNGLKDEAVEYDNEEETSKQLQDHIDEPSLLQC